jgi:hypothetical protein
LLYVFSPTCVWCERNLENIRTIVRVRSNLRIVGVSLAPRIKEYLHAKQLLFEAILEPTPTTVMAYRLLITPSTFLISSNGKVIRAWPGAYQGPVAVDVSRVLRVSLPGLIEP